VARLVCLQLKTISFPQPRCTWIFAKLLISTWLPPPLLPAAVYHHPAPPPCCIACLGRSARLRLFLLLFLFSLVSVTPCAIDL
jgi:hypothetical protein